MADVVYFHGDCPDGTLAAVLWTKHVWPDAELRPARYEETVLDVEVGDRVAILDFSFDAASIERAAKTSQQLVLLDHHASAVNALAAVSTDSGVLAVGLPYSADAAAACASALEAGDHVVYVCSNTHCGALMVAELIGASEAELTLARYIDDRDRWKHEMAFTTQINAAIRSRGVSPEVMRSLLDSLHQSEGGQDGWAEVFRSLSREGEVVERTLDNIIQSAAQSALTARLPLSGDAWFTASVALAPYVVASDLANHLLESTHQTVAIVLAPHAPGILGCSVRSSADSPVSAREVAELYGGGGHERAAGFRIPSHQLSNFWSET